MKVIDMYSKSVQLNISGERSLSNIESIVISIVVFALSLSFIIYTFLDIYLNKRPVLSYSEEASPQGLQEIDLNQLKLGIVMHSYSNEPSNYYQRLLKRPLYDQSSLIRDSFSYTNSRMINTKKIGTLKDDCLHYKEEGVSQDMYNDFFDKAMCYDIPSTESTALLGGNRYLSETQNSIQTQMLFLCEDMISENTIFNNTTVPPYDCSKEVLDFGIVLGSSHLDIYTDKGYQSYLDIERKFDWQANKVNVIEVSLHKNTITTDKSVFPFGGQEENTFYQAKVNSFLVQEMSVHPLSPFIHIEIRYTIDNKVTKFQRSYLKLTDVIGICWGTVKLIVLFGSVFSKVNVNAFEYEVINNIFYDSEDRQIGKEHRNSSTIIERVRRNSQNTNNSNTSSNNLDALSDRGINSNNLRSPLVEKTIISLNKREYLVRESLNKMSQGKDKVNCNERLKPFLQEAEEKVNDHSNHSSNDSYEDVSSKSEEQVNRPNLRKPSLIERLEDNQLKAKFSAFHYKAGCCNTFSNLCRCFHSEQKKLELKKKQLLEEANKETDIAQIISKLIQHDHMFQSKQQKIRENKLGRLESEDAREQDLDIEAEMKEFYLLNSYRGYEGN